jgi:hypothetical protein
MSANEAASFLSSLTPPDSDYEIVERELNQLTRKPGEKLFPIVNKLKALAMTMYRDMDEPDKSLLIERVLMNGLISLTAGETKKELERALVLKKKRQEKVQWDKAYEAVLASEEEHGMPTEVLYYRTSSELPILNFNVSHRIVTAPATFEPQVCTKFSTRRSNLTTPRLTVDTRFPPPMVRSKPDNNSGSFLEYRDDMAKDISLSEAGTESSVSTPSVSSPLQHAPSTKSGGSIVMPNKQQMGINNISIDVLAVKVAEQMHAKRTDFKKSDKDKKSKERKSRKDKYEENANGKNESRDSSEKSNGSSRSRSVSNRRERKKTWSDTDFKAKRGIDCSRDYDPKREKRCLKCLTEGTHHEFQCTKFLRRATTLCPNCDRGYHWKAECDKPLKKSSSETRDYSNPKNAGN